MEITNMSGEIILCKWPPKLQAMLTRGLLNYGEPTVFWGILLLIHTLTSNDSFAKLLLGHACVITSHIFIWILLLIHACNPEAVNGGETLR